MKTFNSKYDSKKYVVTVNFILTGNGTLVVVHLVQFRLKRHKMVNIKNDWLNFGLGKVYVCIETQINFGDFWYSWFCYAYILAMVVMSL